MTRSFSSENSIQRNSGSSSQHSFGPPPEIKDGPQEFSFEEVDFQKLSELIYNITGIVVKSEKRFLVYSRLSKRLRNLSIPSFRAYYTYITSDAGKNEIGYLINAITTNLTRFFREEHHFDHLKNSVIPFIVDRYHHDPSPCNKRVRFWSAGCSSGEEPYSLAMTLAAHLPQGFDVKILATDIDTNMLKKGKEGHYSTHEGIPPSYLSQFCSPHPQGGIQMNPSIMSLVTFNPLNLLHQWPMKGPFNGIFCRNVVIYFDKKTQSDIFFRMAPLLEDQGYLMIGHSESLFKVCDAFELKGQTMYQKVFSPEKD